MHVSKGEGRGPLIEHRLMAMRHSLAVLQSHLAASTLYHNLILQCPLRITISSCSLHFVSQSHLAVSTLYHNLILRVTSAYRLIMI